MHPWAKYLFERYNPLFSMIVIIGAAASAVILNNSYFQPFPFVISCLVIFYTTFTLRLRNDIEDLERDRIAFPKRPLPQKLISRQEAEEVFYYLKFGQLIFFAGIFILSYQNTRLALLLASGYFWLLLNDFFAKRWLLRHPLSKCLAELGFIFFLAIFVVSIGRPSIAFASSGIAFALQLFGAYFVFEICRKLNPYSHPISLTFIHFYGFRITFIIAVFFLALSAIGAFMLGCWHWLWPAELAVLFSLTLLFKRPKSYRLAEIAASLSLILHAWAGLLQTQVSTNF